MTARRFFLLLLIFSFPLTVHAGVSADDLPGDLVWYMHADLEEMRATESGSPLYDWFDDEVIAEINDEVGINLSTEVDSVTAFSDGADSTVIIVEGPLTKSSQDKLLAMATLEATSTSSLVNRALPPARAAPYLDFARERALSAGPRLVSIVESMNSNSS